MRRTSCICLLVMIAMLTCGIAPLQQSATAQKPDPPPLKKISNKDFDLRIIRVGNTFQSIRFKVSTGESWTMVVDRFEKVPETGPVPAGSYDIKLVTDDTNWMAFRIDNISGATWQMRGNKWHKVKEPGEKDA